MISGCLVVQGVLAGSDDDLAELRAQSEQYATSAEGCAFVDGYQCSSQIEDDFLNAASQEKMLSGNFLKAWLVTIENFQSQADQTSEQTRLKHYKIGFSESKDHYVVLFQGLLLPMVEDGTVTGLSRLTFGRTTKYWVNKKTFKIEKKLFYK